MAQQHQRLPDQGWPQLLPAGLRLGPEKRDEAGRSEAGEDLFHFRLIELPLPRLP